MSNIVIFGSTQSGKTTLLGYLSTGMLRNPQFNEEVLKNLKLIKSLTVEDEFSIGNPYNPVDVNKEVILPSFVSLDKNELKKFRNESSEGTTKRLHHKQLTICMSEGGDISASQNENENVLCTFVDLPGFRQRLSDKYRGFFEGDIGIAVLKLSELLELYNLINNTSTKETISKIDEYEGRLFEPIRVWCDYRSPSRLMIVISQIDRNYDKNIDEEKAIQLQREDIQKAIDCIKINIGRYNRGVEIPISPISIRITSEKNIKSNPRMSVFFRREAENIYRSSPKKSLPGSGTLISCLRKIMVSSKMDFDSAFSMSSVNQVMKAIVNGSSKTALNVHAIHGTIHKYDKVMIGPVIEKEHNEIVFAACEIQSIKADGASMASDILLRGNVGGIIFNYVKNEKTNIKYNLRYKVKESDLTILKSTILYNGEIKQGNIVKIEIIQSEYLNINGTIDEIYSRVLPSLMPYDEVYLFWYGKRICVNLVEIVKLKEKIQLSVILSKNEKNSTQQFILPCDENGSIKHHDNVLLAIPRAYYSSLPTHIVQNKYTYVSCCISEIKSSFDYDAVVLRARSEVDLQTILSDNVHIERSDNNMEVNSVIIPIKDCKKKIDIYSVFTKIGRNIKKWFNHQSYRQLGGINIKLIKKSSTMDD